MTIKIPKHYMGEPIEGSMERILAGAPLQPAPIGQPSAQPFILNPANINNAHEYIILPGATHGSYTYPEMLVAMERTHHGKNWNDAHELLVKENAYMLTIRQFVDFLSLLKSGKAFDGNGRQLDKGKLEDVLNDIIEVREPWRSEWLDAKFEDGNIIYHALERKSGSYTLVETKEPLVNYIKKDKSPGIDLSDWLANATYQGLPSKNVNDGSLYYWKPKDGTVARFVAGSVWAVLYCCGYPSGTYSSLGVRAVRAKI